MCSICATASSIAADAHCNMYLHMIFMNMYTCAWIQRVWHEPQVLVTVFLGYCIPSKGLLYPLLPPTPTPMNKYLLLYIRAHRYGVFGASHRCALGVLNLGYCVQVCSCPLRCMYIYIYIHTCAHRYGVFCTSAQFRQWI